MQDLELERIREKVEAEAGELNRVNQQIMRSEMMIERLKSVKTKNDHF